ncbi:MAG: class I SAM-dependent methyltransferase [Gaiellaceae bacterium]
MGSRSTTRAVVAARSGGLSARPPAGAPKGVEWCHLALLPEFGPKPAIHRRAFAREATSFYGERIRLRGQLPVQSADAQAEGREVKVMAESVGGSATRWGALFGARASAWAETWEGPTGWGTPVYEHVLDRAEIGPGTLVVDCGCGAGRFTRMAADRGAGVAGIDASEELIEIAAERTPEGDFRVGAAALTPYEDDEIECPIVFDDVRVAERAFMGAGPTQLAIGTSGEAAVAEAVRAALEPFVAPDGRVVLPAWYRAALARG